MWRTLILAAAAILAAGCRPKPDPTQAARLTALEAENRDLRDRLQRGEPEKAAPKEAPAAPPRTPAHKMEKKESVQPVQDYSAEVSRLRSLLGESQAAVADLEARIARLETELAAAVEQSRKLAAAESALS